MEEMIVNFLLPVLQIEFIFQDGCNHIQLPADNSSFTGTVTANLTAVSAALAPVAVLTAAQSPSPCQNNLARVHSDELLF